MGLRFRQILRLAPGLKLNIGKKGLNSLSLGRSGATLNIGRKGLHGAVGLPGTGLSYRARLELDGRPDDRESQEPCGQEMAKPGFIGHALPALAGGLIMFVEPFFWLGLILCGSSAAHFVYRRRQWQNDPHRTGD